MSNWAKMASNLDRNRKVRKAGANAREVFLYVLRMVADRNTSGWVPADEIDDLEYLADQLMRDVTDVRDGRDAALRVDLLHRDGDRIYVSGWDAEWDRRHPMSDAERQKKRRERVKSGTCTETDTSRPSRDVTKVRDAVTKSRDASRDVTEESRSHESHGREESREEERRERDQTRAPASHASRDVTNVRDASRDVTDNVTAWHATTATTPTAVASGPSLATELWTLHAERYAALNAALNAGLPGLLPAGHAVGWRDLRDRIAAFTGDADAARKACMHVLEVREAEARKRRDLQYFGDKVWREDQFSHALSTKPPAARRSPAASSNTPEVESKPYLDWLPANFGEE